MPGVKKSAVEHLQNLTPVQILPICRPKAKKKARHLSESTRENVDHLIDDIKETTDKIIEEGLELTKEKKAEILAAIDAGKKAMEEERKKIEKQHTG